LSKFQTLLNKMMSLKEKTQNLHVKVK